MAEQFYALITDIGLAKITNGLINNTKVDFTHMATGDGGGSYYNPSTSQTGLVREMWRGPVGMVAIDEKDSNRVQIVSPIPPNAGGFFIREVGLFDAEGDLIVIAKHPETYKPVVDNGSTKDLTVKLLIDVANASSIVMKLDPTVITATREYVDSKIAPINTNLTQLKENFIAYKETTDNELERLNDEIGGGGIVTRLDDIENSVGSLENLTTEEKSNLVAAINSVRQSLVTHTNDSSKHVTTAEKTLWNGFADGKINKLAKYTGSSASQIDPNTTLESTILTSHSNAPSGTGGHYYIITLFYNNVSVSANRSQLAIHYNNCDIAMRSYYNGTWTPWMRIGDSRHLLTTDKVIVGAINELFTSVSNGKSLIANAITQMGVPTATNAEFATMSANISAINPGLKKAGGITTAQNTLDIPAGTFDFTPKMIVTHSSVSNDTFYSVYYAADFMYPGSPQVGYTISRYNGGTNSAGISATIRHGGFIIITTPGYDTYARNASWVALG